MNLQELYEDFHEETRLFQGYASQVEYLTTMQYIHMYAKRPARILELGAGCGAYSLALAKEGFCVTAVEPVDRHVELLKAGKTATMDFTILQSDAAHLPDDWTDTFDMVLCLGPLYHLKEKEQQLQAIASACRVCRKGGILLLAYIPHDMVLASEAMHLEGFLTGDAFDHETLQLHNDPFVFHDEQHIEELFQPFPLIKKKHIAADGLAELMSERINRFTAAEFAVWMRYHLKTCEKPSFLGHSNHNLFITEKKGQ